MVPSLSGLDYNHTRNFALLTSKLIFRIWIVWKYKNLDKTEAGDNPYNIAAPVQNGFNLKEETTEQRRRRRRRRLEWWRFCRAFFSLGTYYDKD